MVDPAPKAKSPATLTARGQRTRSALVAAARTVFERDGFLNARITDIAETAGVAHGSFYSYFPSKEEAFRAVIRDLQEELTHSRREQSSDRSLLTIHDVVLDANRRYFTTWRDHTALMRLWEDVSVLDEEVGELFDATRMAFVHRTEAAISRLQEMGLIDEHLDTRIAAFGLTAMVSRFAYVWFTRGDDHDFDTAAEQITRLWLNGLGLAEQDRKLPAENYHS